MPKINASNRKTLFALLVLSLLFSFTSSAYSNTTLRQPAASSDGGTKQELAYVLGQNVSSAEFSRLVALGKELTGRAFTEKRAFVVIGQSPEEIERQVKAYGRDFRRRTGKRLDAKVRDALVKRLANASDFIATVLRESLSMYSSEAYANAQTRLRKNTRFVLVLDENGIPALVSDGVVGTFEHKALVAYAGRHLYEGWRGGDTSAGQPRSIYLSLAQVEAFMKRAAVEIGKGKTPEWDVNKEKAFALKLFHLDSDLQLGRHEEPDAEVLTTVNSAISEIFEEYRQARLAKVEADHKRKLSQVTTTAASVDVGRWFQGANRIPDELVDFVKDALEKVRSNGTIKSFHVEAAGPDLVIQVNHQKGGENPAIYKMIEDVVRNALGSSTPITQADDHGAYAKELRERVEAYPLDLRVAEASYKERGAEPILIGKGINAGPGFFNMAIFSALVHPDRQSTTTIDGFTAPGYRFVLTSIEDLKAGVKNPKTLSFTTPTDFYLLQAFASNPDLWAITEVYTSVGPGEGGKIPTDEPVVAVSYQSAFNARGKNVLLNPTVIVRTQSGSPAVGEFTNAFFRPHISVGGPVGEHNVAVFPVSVKEARSASVQTGRAKVAVYGYQSSNEGEIPYGEVYDQVPRSSEAEIVRKTSSRLAEIMVSHGEFDPFVTAGVAEARAEATKAEHENRFEKLPDAGEDPVLEEAKRKARFTATLIKIDTGGDEGHQGVPEEYRMVTETNLQVIKESIETQLFTDSHFGWAGDDNQINGIQKLGPDHPGIHGFAIQNFWRQVWVATTLGHKWYGRGQDLVGEAIQRGTLEERANLNDAFIQALAEEFENKFGKGNRYATRLTAAYSAWKSKVGEGQEVAPPYSGNVQGQGPGYAELPLAGPSFIGKLAMDKTGPAAFNIPFHWAVNQALERGIYEDLIYEIWDTEAHDRIFASAKEEGLLARQLLGAVNRFNIKRIWGGKEGTTWNPSNPLKSISDFPIVAASTERLSIISGGEYLGKDDPVALGHAEFMDLVLEFMREHFYLTQGDERGSHYMMPRTEPLEKAIATLRSKAIQTAERFFVDEDGKYVGREDIYADPTYDVARERQVELNELVWGQQGSEWPPIGVGPAQIEPAYPLAKLMREVTAEGSEYLMPRELTFKEAVEAAKWAGLFPSIARPTSVKAVRQAHDIDTKTIVINTDVFLEGPDSLLAIQNYLKTLGFDSIENAVANSSVKLYLNVPDYGTHPSAEAYVDALLQEANAAETTQGAVSVKREWFSGVVAGKDPEKVIAQVLEDSGASKIDRVIGPADWTKAFVEVPGTDLVGIILDLSPENEARSGASALIAAVESLANGGVIDAEFAKAINIQVLSDRLIQVTPVPVTENTSEALKTYRQRMSQV